jgi:hypothetical protein
MELNEDSTQLIMAERVSNSDGDRRCKVHVWDFETNQSVLDIDDVFFNALQRKPLLDIRGYALACVTGKIKEERKTLQVFDLKNRHLAHELENYNPSQVLLTCEGKKIVFATNLTNSNKGTQLMLWDWIENKVEELDTKFDPTATLSTATDSRYLLSSFFDMKVDIYDLFSDTFDKKIRTLQNCGGFTQETQNYLLTNDEMNPTKKRLIKIAIEGDTYEYYKKLYGEMTPEEQAIYKGFKF